MKLLFLVIVIASASCSSSDKLAATAPINGTNKSSTVVIDKWTLTLRNDSDKCVLFYRSNDQDDSKESTVPLDIAAPCEFVRKYDNPEQPLYFKYDGEQTRRVVIITGGEPDKELKDALQPEGCGTNIKKIRLYNDRIDTNEQSRRVGPTCPTWGLEEKWFAFLNFGHTNSN